jgi:hypothetical protein
MTTAAMQAMTKLRIPALLCRIDAKTSALRRQRRRPVKRIVAGRPPAAGSILA